MKPKRPARLQYKGWRLGSAKNASKAAWKKRMAKK